MMVGVKGLPKLIQTCSCLLSCCCLCAFCRIITAALVSFAVLAGGVGVGMARFRETPDPAAPRGLSSAQASTPDAGHAQSALMEGNAVAGARYGTMP